MTTAPALLPCPFCDSQFVMSGRDFESYPAPNYYIAFCSSCDAVGPNKDAPEQAIAAWNARPGDAARETAITEAIQALIDAGDYFSARADVNDGDYGVPSPNREMTLASQCGEALERLEALRTHGASHD